MGDSNKKNYWWIWIAVVIVVIILIVIYVITLGSADVGQKSILPKELKASKEDALKRHEALKKELDKQTALRDKLERKFKRAYRMVRVGLLAIWLGPLSCLYYFGIVRDIGDALNYSEGSFIIIAILNFITFGNLTNLDSFLAMTRNRVENLVWGKYITLPEDIKKTQQEIASLSLDTNKNGYPKIYH